MGNAVFHCCGEEFIGAFDNGLPPHCKICGKYPRGYRRSELKIKKRSNYVPVGLKVRMRVVLNEVL